jgi:type II secretory pathway pseudopilin PulG
MSNRARRKGESGFALLFVFLMAAIIAISLYSEMPRVAFEAQRTEEQILIDRGQEYQRAIQLYFRKFKTYPPNLEALENTNNIRFLRKRYKDPMTKDGEWRLVHVGPGGVFTDSLVRTPPEKKEGQGSVNTFITEGPAIGSEAESSQSVPRAAIRRPSEGGVPYPGSVSGTDAPAGVYGQPVAGMEEQSGAVPPQQTGEQQPGPGGQPGNPQVQGVYPTIPVSPQPGMVPGQTAPGQQGSPVSGQPLPFPFMQQQGQTGAQPQQGVYPQLVPGQPGPAYPFPRPPGSQTQGQSTTPYPPAPVPGVPNPQFPSSQQAPNAPSPYQTQFQTQLGSSGPTPGQQPAGFAAAPGQNPAVDLIRKLLTTPNPRGLAAIQQKQGTGQQIGGGIAGVASKLDAEGIKVYNDRTNYTEWEFIYDFSQDRTNAGLTGARGTGTNPQQPGTPAKPALGGPGTSQQPGFGQLPGPIGPRRPGQMQ